jgi:hypothetical protein
MQVVIWHCWLQVRKEVLGVAWSLSKVLMVEK